MTVQEAWRRVRKQWGVSELVEETGLSRSTLYRASRGIASENTTRILVWIANHPKWPDDPYLQH